MKGKNVISDMEEGAAKESHIKGMETNRSSGESTDSAANCTIPRSVYTAHQEIWFLSTMPVSIFRSSLPREGSML